MRWITVCGGGNGAHALVGTLLLRDETYSEEIKDTSSLARKFQTNLGYQPLKVPVKKVNAGYQVDVATRYLTEDVPFSLLVTKGIALVVGVETRWGTCWA